MLLAVDLANPVSYTHLYERVKDSDERPILNGNMNVEYISGLMEKRKERYEAVADVTAVSYTHLIVENIAK